MAGSSAGSAAAVLVKAFRTRNASIGERSSVPPSGGIMPRNMFRYGSHKVLRERQRAKTTNRRVRNDIDCLRKGKERIVIVRIRLCWEWFSYIYTGHFLGEKRPS